MPTLTYQPEDSGAIVRPPQFRVLVRPVITTETGLPCWGQQRLPAGLLPAQLRWGINGQATTLALKCCLGTGPGRETALRGEEPADWPTTGDEVRLVDETECEWFAGHVAQESVLIQASPDVETRTYVAYGPEVRLRGQAVHGQWCKRPAADEKERTGTLTADDAVRANIFLADHPTVFNTDGKPNASQAVDRLGNPVGWLLTGRGELADTLGAECRAFEAEDRQVKADDSEGWAIQAEYWTAYTALRSLVEYVDNYTVVSPKTDWSGLKAQLESVVLGQVAVEGLDLAEAMGQVLGPAGFGFCLEPWSDGDDYADGLPRHILHVFALHPQAESGEAPVLADVSAGRPGIADLAGQEAQVQRLDFLRDSHNVRNEVRVIGAPRRVQVCLAFHNDADTRDLHPAWDATEHDLSPWAKDDVIPEMDDVVYDGQDPPDGQDFINRYSRGGGDCLQFVDALRTFVWNEDGAYRPRVPVEPDLAVLLGTADYARRPRPMGPTLIRAAGDTAGGMLPAYVEIGIVGDDDAWILLPQAEVLRDRAGFTVNAPRLDRFYPYRSACEALREKYYLGGGKYSFATLLYNALREDAGPTDYKLRLRLVGSITADVAVTGHAPYPAGSSWPFRAVGVEYRPERFRQCLVAAGGNPRGLETVTRDDTSAVQAYADQALDARQDAMGHGSIVLRRLLRTFRPGMAWARTRGRQVDLTVDGGRQAYMACVVGVAWIFEEGAGKTELLLDSALLKVTG